MPSVTCTNCGAVLKTQTDIPAGKKVKCPKCAQPFVVQAEAAPKPEEPEKNPFATDAGDAPDTTKKKGDGGDGKAKKSNKRMIILLSVAGIVLLCCCPLTCVGGFFGWRALSDSPSPKDEFKPPASFPRFDSKADKSVQDENKQQKK